MLSPLRPGLLKSFLLIPSHSLSRRSHQGPSILKIPCPEMLGSGFYESLLNSAITFCSLVFNLRKLEVF